MDTQTKEGNRVYEIGYLLVSSIPEEKVAGEVQKIKDLVSENGGELIAEGAPVLRPLSYSIVKAEGGSRKKYDSAHFGWVKFEIPTGTLLNVKKGMDTNSGVLRYLLINTVRENTMVQKQAAPKAARLPKEAENAPKKGMSEEEIDKTIDELVVE